ncbi:uncharacterized protein VTP21DRAFT_9728 [Calcarisporiella thermophila]|uniref:uncharacterized protein n=1 Tax=Calcarisporiella thermophila TaxID=911321 RepID=UPI0037433BFB
MVSLTHSTPNSPRLSARSSLTRPLELHQRRRVLICHDNSASAASGFEWALQNVLRPGEDHVILATVVDKQETSILYAGRPTSGRRLSVAETDEATELLRPLADRLVSLGITTQIHVVHGDPKEKLVKLAELVRADMVIVGSRGLGGLKRLLGSVSDYLVRHLDIPVIVTKNRSVQSVDMGRRRSTIGSMFSL